MCDCASVSPKLVYRIVVPFFRFTQKPWNNAIRGMALLVAVQWNLPYPDLYYPVNLLGGFYTTLLLGDNTFIFTAQGRDHECTVVTSAFLLQHYSMQFLDTDISETQTIQTAQIRYVPL